MTMTNDGLAGLESVTLSVERYRALLKAEARERDMAIEIAVCRTALRNAQIEGTTIAGGIDLLVAQRDTARSDLAGTRSVAAAVQAAERRRVAEEAERLTWERDEWRRKAEAWQDAGFSARAKPAPTGPLVERVRDAMRRAESYDDIPREVVAFIDGSLRCERELATHLEMEWSWNEVASASGAETSLAFVRERLGLAEGES